MKKNLVKYFKRIINNSIRPTGYEIKQVLYQPWLEDWFQKYYQKARLHTLVAPDRCFILHQFARQCVHLTGDYAEAGVYKGGTAHLLAETLVLNGGREKSLYLFDTFAGMPETANEDDGPHKEGDFGDTSLMAVQNYLRGFDNLVFKQGFIPNTFDEVEARQFAFVHIDVDLYQTGLDCAEFFYPKMPPGGIMIFDDYGFEMYRNALRKAVDDFFADKPEVPVPLTTGQCIIIKL